MALKLLEFLQVLVLDGFTFTSELAYWLHRRAYRRAGSTEPVVWSRVAQEPPAFRIGAVAPLRHRVAAHVVVDAQVRQRGPQLFRMVEVGVFEGNLSKHVWQHGARMPGAKIAVRCMRFKLKVHCDLPW